MRGGGETNGCLIQTLQRIAQKRADAGRNYSTFKHQNVKQTHARRAATAQCEMSHAFAKYQRTRTLCGLPQL
eukprot:11173444-Lingulodinium_polyedra.AAC.1